MRRELETEVITTRFSSAIGWIITLSRALEEDGDREIGEIAADLQEIPCFADETRVCHGWAILIFFTVQVDIAIYAVA